MAPRREKSVGLTLAAAGVGIVGVSVVLGLTTESGGIDWVGIVTATAGLVMVLTGLFRTYGPRSPHVS
jgi:hypothetical protein